MRIALARIARRPALTIYLAAVACAANIGAPILARAQPVRRERAVPSADSAALRREIDELSRAMVAAFNASPASVAGFYTDDARIIGGGQRAEGRQQIDAYWSQIAGYRDWSLEVFAVGGHPASPWLLGRSTITAPSGRASVVDFLGVLRRMPDGSLKYQVDFYTSAPGPANRRQSPAPATPAVPAAPGSTELRTPFNGPAHTVLVSGATDVPLRKIGQYYYIDVQVNGRPFRFTLETGAGFFGISARAAQSLGLRVDTVEVMPGTRAPVVLIESLTMPGITLEKLSARVVPTFAGSDFDGIISIPVLRDVLATIDLGASRLRLERGELPVPNGRDVFAFAGKDRGGRIDFEMSLGGVTVPAVIDSRSFISVTAPDSLQRMLPLADSPRLVGNARGPSLGSFTLRGAHLSSDIRIGAYGVQRPAIVLRNRPGVVVGVPFLEQFAITIDQQNQRIRFARPGRGTLAVIPPEEWEATPATATLAVEPAESTGSGPTRAVTGAPPTARPMGFNLAGSGSGDLVVVNLVPGSNADRAGIRNEDRLAEFDGTPVGSMNAAIFRAALSKRIPIKVVVVRDGKRLEFMIQPQPGQ